MIRFYPDDVSLAEAAAKLFVSEARSAIDRRGRFTVALSGGTTPRQTYRLLTALPYRNQVDWRKVMVFWGDERCVPADDPNSNERMARKALLDHVPIPTDQVFPMRCAASPENAARKYEELLVARIGSCGPGFDLIFLGMGQNGHTASLFPGDGATREQKRHAAAVHLFERDSYRVTLTAKAINRSRTVAFLVCGEQKAGILKAVLEGPRDPRRLPAQLILPENGRLLWLVDHPAGKLLKSYPGDTSDD